MVVKHPLGGVIGGLLLLRAGMGIGYLPLQFAMDRILIGGGATLIGLVLGVVIFLSGVGVLLRVVGVGAHRDPDLSTLLGGAGIVFSLLSVASPLGSVGEGIVLGVVGGVICIVWQPAPADPDSGTESIRDSPLRTLLVVAGLSLLAIGVFSFGLQVTHWQATSQVTPREQVDEHEPVTNISDLPPACRRIVRAMVAGQTVSTEVYQLQMGETTLLVRNTNLSSGGWHLSDVNCIDSDKSISAAGIDQLRVNDEYYSVVGSWHKGDVDRKQLFELLQWLSIATGGIFLFFGLSSQNYWQEIKEY